MLSALTPTTPLAVGLLLAGAALAGCADGGAGAGGGVQAGQPAPPSPVEDCTPAPLAERAAAVLVVGIPGVADAEEPLAQEVLDVGVSGVFLNHDNIGDGEQLSALVAGMRERAGRPLLVATDDESGRVAVTRKVVGSGPSPRRLAAERTPEEVREFARELGESLAEIGIDFDLAPLLDLDDGPSGGIIGDRSFSADPQEAADYGLAFSRGLADSGVHPTVKHFPGHGRSTADTHKKTEVITTSVDELRETDLAPFQEAIDSGIPAVMLNHLSYTDLDADLPASLSPRAYALLREMGFEGVAITDSLGMGPVHSRWDFPEAAVMAIEAGADMALTTDGRQAAGMRDALVEAVESGRLPEERLNEAAGRATALAGGDPKALACSDAVVPELREDPETAGGPASSAGEPASDPTRVPTASPAR